MVRAVSAREISIAYPESILSKSPNAIRIASDGMQLQYKVNGFKFQGFK